MQLFNIFIRFSSELKKRTDRELEFESEKLKKLHADKLNALNLEFEREKQTRREKFMSQMSKYVSGGGKSGGDGDLDELDEKKEIAVIMNKYN